MKKLSLLFTLILVLSLLAGCQDVAQSTPSGSLSAGGRHTVGLKADGTVVATGENDIGQCNVKEWKFF